MPPVASLHPLVAAVVTLGLLFFGAWLAAAIDHAVVALLAGRSPRAALVGPLRSAAALLQQEQAITERAALVGPLRSAAALLQQEQAITERPDVMLWLLAPASYAAVAAAALAVVPLGEGIAVADVRTGIVLFGAAEALAIVAVFMHGWAANSHLSLLGGYRFVALGLSYELVSMFVLIAAALPAESLQVSAIVHAQEGLWNVVRQPLALPLWLVVTLGVTFRGPLSLADSRDLSGGTSLETTGRHRLLWQAARGGMLLVFSGMGAAIFLGGWHGPWLPGWAWMLLKTFALMLVAAALGHRVGRIPIERAVTVLWCLLLPLSFLHLALAGWEALA